SFLVLAVVAVAVAVPSLSAQADPRAQLTVQTGHTNAVSSVAYSPDGKYIASGGWDGSLILWHVETGAQIRSMNGHVDNISSIAFSLDGKYIASGSVDETVRLWDVET